ncbi:GLTP1 [Symbiodinium sp. CCMP2592]|nr:GLTP1 [Symbiodinium sp. CCMP2592]
MRRLPEQGNGTDAAWGFGRLDAEAATQILQIWSVSVELQVCTQLISLGWQALQNLQSAKFAQAERPVWWTHDSVVYKDRDGLLANLDGAGDYDIIKCPRCQGASTWIECCHDPPRKYPGILKRGDRKIEWFEVWREPSTTVSDAIPETASHGRSGVGHSSPFELSRKQCELARLDGGVDIHMKHFLEAASIYTTVLGQLGTASSTVAADIGKNLRGVQQCLSSEPETRATLRGFLDVEKATGQHQVAEPSHCQLADPSGAMQLQWLLRGLGFYARFLQLQLEGYPEAAAEAYNETLAQYHSTLTAFTFKFLITAMPSKDSLCALPALSGPGAAAEAAAAASELSALVPGPNCEDHGHDLPRAATLAESSCLKALWKMEERDFSLDSPEHRPPRNRLQTGRTCAADNLSALVRDAAAAGSEGQNLAAAARLGDSQRLASFVAFKHLPVQQQEALLAMGVPEGSCSIRETERVIHAFLQDFPVFAAALDWKLFVEVVGIVSERGSRLSNGDYALYKLMDLASHSCQPNAVVETLGEDGLRELRCLSYAGIAENEEITTSYVAEEVLLQPSEPRHAAIRAERGGWQCACNRCKLDGEVANDLRSVSAQLRRGMEVPPLRERLQALKAIDTALPFAMAAKARVRFSLAQACEAAVDQGLFEEAKMLYETALDETEIVLGQKGLRNLANIKRRLEQLLETMA